MSNTTENWSNDWNSSTNPQKQRKYRENAPQHVKDTLISVNLSETLREELGARSISLNLGDRVKVMRGDRKGAEGIVSNIDRQKEKVYINGIEVTRQDGSTSEIPFRPSNLQAQALNLEKNDRIEKYEIDESSDIRVDSEEVEEALEEDEANEMMQKMQGGGQSMEDMDIDEEELEEMEEEMEELEEETEEVEEEFEGSEEETDSEEVEEEEESEDESDSEESEEEETEEDESDEKTEDEEEKGDN
ncbi:MAG: 50S ribosomal protein L24 [Candidatus Nanohalobium sp.]